MKVCFFRLHLKVHTNRTIFKYNRLPLLRHPQGFKSVFITICRYNGWIFEQSILIISSWSLADKFSFQFLFRFLPGVFKIRLYPLQSSTPPKKWGHWYDTKLRLMIRFLFWRFTNFGVTPSLPLLLTRSCRSPI